MTEAELLAQARLYLDDQSEPYLWDDDELTLYLEDAEFEAAIRADLIEESSNDTYCSVALVADQNEYTLDDLIYEVVRARVSGGSHYLERTSREVLDVKHFAWDEDSGTPREYFLRDGNKLTVYPTPTEDGTLKLTVLRAPVSMDTSPEINRRHHMRLLDWVYYRAYSKHDADTYDKRLAATHQALFEMYFGPRKDAKTFTRFLKHQPATVREVW